MFENKKIKNRLIILYGRMIVTAAEALFNVIYKKYSNQLNDSNNCMIFHLIYLIIIIISKDMNN